MSHSSFGICFLLCLYPRVCEFLNSELDCLRDPKMLNSDEFEKMPINVALLLIVILHFSSFVNRLSGVDFLSG